MQSVPVPGQSLTQSPDSKLPFEGEPEFTDIQEFIDDTFETLQHTKSRMDKMLLQLTEKNVLHDGSDSLVSLSECVKQVVEQRCASYFPAPNVLVSSETPVVLDTDVAQ